MSELVTTTTRIADTYPSYGPLKPGRMRTAIGGSSPVPIVLGQVRGTTVKRSMPEWLSCRADDGARTRDTWLEGLGV